MHDCWLFSSRRPPSPPASSLTTSEETINSHAPTVVPSAQEETPRRVTTATKQAFQSPRFMGRTLSSVERPFSVTSIPSPLPQGSAQTAEPDFESSDLVTPLRSPRRSTLHHYPLAQHSPLQILVLGRPAYVEENAFTNVVLPNTPDNSASESPVRPSQQNCEISHRSRSAAAASERKEESSDEGVSAAEITDLILSEHRPGSTVPEMARRTRLVFSNDEREIYQVSFPDDPDMTPIFFDMKTQASTPSLHGVSQGLDDD